MTSAARMGKRRTSLRRTRRLVSERLEARQLLAVTWATDSDGFWDDPANWSDNQVPDSLDDVIIDRGSANPVITIRDTRQVRTLSGNEAIVIASGTFTTGEASTYSGRIDLAGGGLQLNAELQIALGGMLNWTAGSLSGTTLRNAGTVRIDGVGDKSLSVTVFNSGIWQHAGSGDLQTSRDINNDATGIYDFQADVDLRGPIFRNTGTLRKSGGAGISTIESYWKNAPGAVVDVQSGSLIFTEGSINSGGTLQVAEGAALVLAGDRNFDWAGTYTGTGTGKVEIRHTLLGMTNAEFPTVTLNFAPGMLHWLSGQLGGGGCGGGGEGGGCGSPIVNAGSISIAQANGHPLGNTLINQGTIWHYDGSLDMNASLINEASGQYYFVGDTAQVQGGYNLLNRGLVVKQTGTGENVFDAPFWSEGGTIGAITGKLSLTEGGFLIGATVLANEDAVIKFTGEDYYTLTGQFTGSGAGILDFAGPNFSSVDGGVANAHAVLNFPEGFLHWTGGSIGSGGCGSTVGCSTTLESVGHITIDGPEPKALVGTGLINAGTIVNAGPGVFDLNGVTLQNRAGAIFEHQGDFALEGLDQFGNVGHFINAGTFKRTGGDGVVEVTAAIDLEAGAVLEVEAGRLKLLHGGTWNGSNFVLSAGAVLELAGNHSYRWRTGTYTGTGLGTIEHVGTAEAADGGIPTFNFPTGMFRWLAGSIFWRLVNNGHLTLDGPGDKFSRIHFTNNGTIVHRGTGNYLFNPDNTFENVGLYDLQSDADIVTVASASVGTAQFINTGILRKSDGTGVTELRKDTTQSGRNMRLDNLGRVEVLSGTLSIPVTIAQVSGSTLSAGTWVINAFASLEMPSVANLQINRATVSLLGPAATFSKLNSINNNQGTFSIAGKQTFTTVGGLTNSGTLLVGPEAVLKVSGALSLTSTSKVQSDISGRPISRKYGRFEVASTAALAGTFAVSEIDGYASLAGDQYPLMQYASRTGSFSGFSGVAGLYTVDVLTKQVVLTSVAPAAIDLTVVNTGFVPAVAAPGEPVTVLYQVENLADANSYVEWVDSIYLSRDLLYSSDDVLLTRVTRADGVEPLGSYQGFATASLPALVDGDYHVIVIANSRGLAPEANRDNNTNASVARISNQVVPLRYLPDPGVQSTIAVGQDQYFKLTVDSGHDVELLGSFATARQAQIFVAYDRVPTPSDFDYVSGTLEDLERTIHLTSPQNGEYYVLVHGLEGAGLGAAYALSAEKIVLAASELSPARGSNQGFVTVAIRGSGFRAGTTASLAGPGGTHQAAEVTASSANELFAMFDLRGLSTGNYQLRVHQDAETAVSDIPFVVNAGVAGRLEIQVAHPSALRPGREGRMTITYANTGETNIPAPWMLLQTENALARLSEQSEFSEGPLAILGINRTGPAGVLPPGSRNVIEVITKLGNQGGNGNYHLVTPAGNETVAWDDFKEQLRPTTITTQAWDVIYDFFKQDVGTSVAQVSSALSNAATYLSKIGIYTADADRLIRFALRNADGFGAISTRYQFGQQGFGRPDPTRYEVTTETNGDVIISYGGVPRFFTKLASGGYRGDPGDTAVLQLIAGKYLLTEPTGIKVAFRADGKWDYNEDPNGYRTTAVYTNGRLTSMVDGEGSSFSYTYNTQGLLETETDPLGRVTTYGYDAAGLHLTSVTDQLGSKFYSYVQGQGAAKEHALASITYSDATQDVFTYDSRGRRKTVTTASGQQRTYEYPSLGEIILTDNTGERSVMRSNEAGTVSYMQSEDGRELRTTYDENGWPINFVGSSGLRVTATYDAAGNMLSSVDPAGRSVGLAYDPIYGRLLLQRDANGNSTRFEYDAQGNHYKTIYPDGSFDEATLEADDGTLSAYVNRASQETDFTYDTSGRLERIDYFDGTFVSYTYDARDNMRTATDASGTIVMDYDASDRMTKITYPGGRWLEFAYDAKNRRTKITHQDGFEVRYVYDAVGRLSQLRNASDEMLTEYIYDSLGRTSRVNRGDGTATTFDYDNSQRLTQMTNLAADQSVLSRFAYTFDASGRRSSVTTLEGTTNYRYDRAGQLVEVTMPSRTIQYEYDGVGNRIATVDNGVLTSYASNNMNEYASVGNASFTYGDEGNLLTRTDASGVTTYGYNARGLITSIVSSTEEIHYEYDALGHRTAEIRNGVRRESIYDPLHQDSVAAQYDGAGQVVSRYFTATGLAGRVDAAGNEAYYHFDGSGNTVQITDEATGVLNQYAYLPYGESVLSVETVENPFTFAGGLGITRTLGDTYLTTARVYDAGLGRFISTDPSGYVGSGANMYTYGFNAPTLASDATGFIPTPTNNPPILPPGKQLHDMSESLINIAINWSEGAENAFLTRYETALGAVQDLSIKVSNGTANNVEKKLLGTAIDLLESSTKELLERGVTELPTAEGMVIKVARDSDTVLRAAKALSTSAENRALEKALDGIVRQMEDEAAYRSAILNRQRLANGLRAGVITSVVTAPLNEEVGAWSGFGGAPTTSPFGDTALKKGARDARVEVYDKLADNARFSTACNAASGLTGAVVTYAVAGSIAGPPGFVAGLAGGILTGIFTNYLCWSLGAPQSFDPNAIIGPAGVGPQSHIPDGGTLPYTILFENLATATAPAQEVVVTQDLDPDLDWTTFTLGDIGFGAVRIDVPMGLQSYQTQVALDAAAEIGNAPLLVDITAAIDLVTGRVTWKFVSLDPETGDLTDNPFAGFLPPDIVDGQGDGFVEYSIKAKTDLASGTRIDALATIVFDTNAPIATAPIFNSLDVATPQTNMPALNVTTTTETFTVQWSGTDEPGGSGIASFDVYVSANGAAYIPWLTRTTATSAQYTGQFRSQYRFAAISRDLVGHANSLSEVGFVSTRVASLAWHNTRKDVDVDDDLAIGPSDVLDVLNYLNTHGAGPLIAGISLDAPPFIDVSGDDYVTPIDALIVINYLNTVGAGEAESAIAEDLTIASATSDDSEPPSIAEELAPPSDSTFASQLDYAVALEYLFAALANDEDDHD